VLFRSLRMSQEALIAVGKGITKAMLADVEGAQKFLDQRYALHTVFDHGIFLLKPDGRTITESPLRPNRRGRDVSFRDFYKSTISSKKPYISKPFTGAVAPFHPLIIMTVPLFDTKGELMGILMASFDLLGQNFLADQAKLKIGQTGYIYIADSDRLTISHPDPVRIMKPGPQPGQNLLFDRAVTGFEGSGRTVTSTGVEMYSSFKHLTTTGWILSANFPVAEAEVPLKKVRIYFTLALGLGALVVLGVTWLIVKSQTAPLASLTQHVQHLPQKNSSERRLELAASGEIGTLITAFNTMVGTLDLQQQTLQENE
jgi:hypothetical protein